MYSHRVVVKAPSIPVLVVLTALMSLGMHTVLPAIPVIAHDFGAQLSTIQLTVPLYMGAVAIAQLVYGPLSDRFGRKPPLLVGLCIFFAGSLICALAPTTPVLLVGRIVQGAGACVGMVLGRAMVRDVYSGDRAVTVLAYVAMAMMAIPGLAPIVGGVMVPTLGWRSVFFGCAIAVSGLLVVAWRLNETHHNRTTLPNAGAMLMDFGHLIRLREFTAPVLALALPNCGFWAFISISPALLNQQLHIPPQEFGFYFLPLPIAYFVGSFLSTRVAPRLGGQRTALLGTSVSTIVASILLTLTLTTKLSALALFLPIAVMNAMIAMTIPSLQLRALSADTRLVGSAAGLMGFAQMACGALATLLISRLYDGTALPAAAIMVTASASAVGLLLYARKRA